MPAPSSISVYPQEGQSYPDADGVPITADGATVAWSDYILLALQRGYLQLVDPYGAYQPDDRTGGGAGGGAVRSVFGRTGEIEAQSGDYSVAQISGLEDALEAKADADATEAALATKANSADVTAALASKADASTTTAALAGKASAAAPFVTFTADSGLSNERVLTAGSGISFSTATPGQLRIIATGGGGGALTAYDTAADLSTVVGSAGSVAATLGVLSPNDGGGGLWQWVEGDTAEANVGTVLGDDEAGRWHRVYSGALNVRWFGALGDGDQTLYATDYMANMPITQNTADALAINRAINFAKLLGGANLYIPAGVYAIYAFLEIIDCNISIAGDGPGITILRNCDASPVNDSRYGIFLVAPLTELRDVSFANFTLDGNVVERGDPGAEYFSYPLVWLGKVRGAVENVVSVNSPIDCMCTTYENADESSLRVSDCVFDTAYRNSVSVVSGANQQYVNCQFLRAGTPFGGHNPRYCIDIEPDDVSTTLKNLQFTNCVFKEANGVAVAGGIWAQARFVNCRFDSSDGPSIANPPGFPYVGIWNGGQFSFVGCSFYGAANRSAFSSSVELSGPFGSTSFVEMKDCYMEGAAPELYCPQIRIEGLAVVNSARPMLLGHGDGTFEQQVYLRGLQLTNVVDPDNLAGGAFASLALADTCNGYWTLADIECTWNGDLVPTSVLADLDAPAACGVYLSPSATATMRVTNVNSAGWYQKYPASHSKTPSSSFLDWSPSSPVPADTTGTALVVGGKFYRGCTEYGNNP